MGMEPLLKWKHYDIKPTPYPLDITVDVLMILVSNLDFLLFLIQIGCSGDGDHKQSCSASV